MNVNYIGISGHAGSGKSYTANRIKYRAKQFNPEIVVHIVPMAYMLKNIVNDFFNLNDKSDEKTRETYQYLGQEMKDRLCNSVHMVAHKHVVEGIKILEERRRTKDLLIIIDDIRFDYELNFVREYGVNNFKAVKIISDRKDKIVEQNTHLKEDISERGLPDDVFDYILDNSTSSVGSNTYNYVLDMICIYSSIFKDSENDLSEIPVTDKVFPEDKDTLDSIRYSLGKLKMLINQLVDSVEKLEKLR